MENSKLTEAGRKFLIRFLDAERCGRLSPLVDWQGKPLAPGMRIRHGDGGDLACAKKLCRDDMVRMFGPRHGKFAVITDAGRAAVSQLEGNHAHRD